MTIREAAEYLRVSPNTLYTWVCKRTIGCKKIGKKAVRFTKADLDAVVSSQPGETTPETKTLTRRGRPRAANVNINAIVERAKREALS